MLSFINQVSFRIRIQFLVSITAMVLGGHASANTQAPNPADSEVLQARIAAIAEERDASTAQYLLDKKNCAKTVLVNRCTTSALSRKRAREAVLRDGQISAKEQLRAQSARAKNADLASLKARTEQDSQDVKQREEALNQRSKKLADAQERLEAHEKKKLQELDNLKAYREKVQRSEEKQAEIRARFKASGTLPKANVMAPMAAPPSDLAPHLPLKTAPTTSVN
jgi:uncharacterized protein (DUF3084 family)